MSALRDRIQAIRQRVDIVDLVGGAVALRRGRSPRARCPFHGSKSDSFALYPDSGTARCWGCGWSGDAIRFVMDYHGLPFREAIERLEAEHGLDGLTAAPVRREKMVRERREARRELVDPVTCGRWIWQTSTRNPEAVRTYLRGRGVPEAMLTDARIADLRFHGLAPCLPWPQGHETPPADWPKAPAMVARIRRPPADPIGEGRVDAAEWEGIGIHVTYLAPDCSRKMLRRRRDGRPYEARKMFGRSLGGCVLLGPWRPEGRLFAGEGIETVLSGMGLAGAGADDCGIAVLSLDNLEGHWRRWRNGATPLHDIRPDPERAPALAFRHPGRVVGLIDADMAPLNGPIDRATGRPRGLPIVEHRGGPLVHRALSPAERTAICAQLFAQAWRAAGSGPVSALRPRMGLDCNDAVREAAA